MDDLPPTRPSKPTGEQDPGGYASGRTELAEAFFDRLRRVDVPEPSGRLAAGVRARLLRRTRYRGSLEPGDLGERVQVAWLRFEYLVRHSVPVRILVGSMLVVLALLTVVPPLVERLIATEASIQRRALEGEKSLVLPVAGPGGSIAPETSAAVREERLTWLTSENDLRRLRALCDERGKVTLRRRLLKIGGADERTRRRIVGLSAEVAHDVAAAAVRPSDYASVEALSLGLRALLAAGSTTVRGPQRSAVRGALNRVERLLPALEGPCLATALAGYLEGALVTGGMRLDHCSRELRRFTAAEFERMQRPPDRPAVRLRDAPRSIFSNPRPILILRVAPEELRPMDTWACPLGALADAGLILRVAPALGASAARASRVRRALYAHLLERGRRPGAVGAAARAALLFSYSDLADRAELVRTLGSYCLHPDLFGHDLRAVHYLAWGVFPGAGWARFNRALRFFTANYADHGPTERAGLLLVQLLYAAPGLSWSDLARSE